MIHYFKNYFKRIIPYLIPDNNSIKKLTYFGYEEEKTFEYKKI